jgi:response regulator NasT
MIGKRIFWHAICEIRAMRLLVVDESPERADLLREGLRRAGYEVTASLSSPGSLLATIEQLKPDVIVIDTESPSRDVLEHLVVMSRHTPRPVVMFASDGKSETIRQAVRAGVSAYVVDGLDPARVRPIVEAAVARFEEMQALRDRLAEANLRLDERKLVERAKGILMTRLGLSEPEAFRRIQKTAMDTRKPMAEVAQALLLTEEMGHARAAKL